MKKAMVVTLSFVLGLLALGGVTAAVICSLPLTADRSRTMEEIDACVQNDLGISDLLLLKQGSSSSPLIKETRSDFIYYALGLTDGVQHFGVIPANEDEEAYSVSWPFYLPYSKIVDAYNTRFDQIVDVRDKSISSLDSKEIEFVDSTSSTYLDFPFLIRIYEVTIGQKNNALVFYQNGQIV